MVTVQADIVLASILAFEKAVALGSYWLSQGVARPGWSTLLSATQALKVSEQSGSRASRHVKRLQSQVVRAGSWLFGVREGDMMSALVQHRPSWGLFGLLLPICAFLSPESAATVLVEITKDDWLANTSGND